MMLGGMVAIICIYAWVMGRVFSLWLTMIMVVVFWFVWATIRAQWMDVMAGSRFRGWTRPLPFHFDE